jgi:hypothetical protein
MRWDRHRPVLWRGIDEGIFFTLKPEIPLLQIDLSVATFTAVAIKATDGLTIDATVVFSQLYEKPSRL